MKEESKQKKTDLTYLYLAHIQRSLHHHLNIQQRKQGHLMLAVHIKGKMMDLGGREKTEKDK
jgi:hypothetical protein